VQKAGDVEEKRKKELNINSRLFYVCICLQFAMLEAERFFLFREMQFLPPGAATKRKTTKQQKKI
jgi:hypothetical protein